MKIPFLRLARLFHLLRLMPATWILALAFVPMAAARVADAGMTGTVGASK